MDAYKKIVGRIVGQMAQSVSQCFFFFYSFLNLNEMQLKAKAMKFRKIFSFPGPSEEERI